MDRRPLWRYYLLVNDEKCHVCMYLCKMDIFSRNDMRWILDNEDLDEKETCESVIFFPMACLYRGRYLGKPLEISFLIFQSFC